MAGNNIVNMTIKANMDISQMSSSISQMQGILQKLKLPDDMRKQFSSLFSTATADLEKYQSKLQSGFKTKGDVTGLEKIGRGLEATFSSIEKEWNKLQGLDISKLVTLDPSSQARIKEIENSFKTLGAELKSQVAPNLQNITTLINQLSTKSSKKGGAQITELLGAGQYEQAIALLDQLILKQQRAVDSFDKGNKKAGVRGQTLQQYEAIREALDQVIPKIQEYNNQANNLQSEKIQIFANATQQANGMLQQGVNIAANATNQMRNYGNATQQAAQQTQQLGYDLDMIKSRIQYFFSLTNGAMLFRRVLQDTIQTTKELDAAMTETAVVTEFDVSDMWKELPRYTALAKELGATIQGVYETMTLYYQQGLKTEEVFEVGTETLKMARIAGLDYAKATDFMTAALRGFNMEVNEINAQKINDVYSNLAAITAADTQEIATAMTKTASIASNANMEFETTAAFLSQIIETTRESAETAGTAMKTVIARFTELKKDPAEIGEVDGEIVDANKIETALRTIDVALRDTSGQFRDLDEVFLDIAEKWDGLDTNTQRYIATMAAGSRQQSRFIAMMSDYSRTMELVNAANNSAGASQKQFDKTLESLEAKLNRLKDAWDEFTMGIANNSLIKAGIDALTGLLELINSLTRNLPGATKGIANLLLMIGGFMGAKKVFDAFIASTLSNVTSLGAMGTKGGTAYGMSFNAALGKEFSKTGALIKTIFAKKTWVNAGTTAINARKGAGGILRERLQAEGELKTLKNARATSILPYSQQTAAIAAQEAQIKKLQATEQAYYSASIPQQNAYLVLKSTGLTTEQAAVALTKELTEEDYKQLAVQSLMNSANYVGQELTEEEIKARIMLIKAKQAELNADKMGLATRAKNLVMLLFGTRALRKKALANFTAAGATWAQKGAQDALNASMLAFPIGWIVLGLTAIIASVVILCKWLHTLTLDYKMEQAAIATEKAKQAAENAKQAYDDLNSAIEEIGTKEDELEKLTYGTLEWQRALLEVNEQVMELIDRFPELKADLLNELTVEASGKLALSSKGYELIKERSLEWYKNTIAGQAVASSHESYLNLQKQLKDLNSPIYHIAPREASKNKYELEGSKMYGMVGHFFGEMLDTYMKTGNTMLSAAPFGIPGMLIHGTATYAIGELAEENETINNLLTTWENSDLNITKKIATGITDYLLGSGASEKAFKFYEKNSERLEHTAKTGENYSKLTKTDKQAITEAIKADPTLLYNTDKLNEFAESNNISTEAVITFGKRLEAINKANLEYEASVRAQAKQLLVSNTSEQFRAKENSSGIADTFSEFYAEAQKTDIENEIKRGEAKTIFEYAQDFGIDNFIDQGGELQNLRKLYQELTGATKEQVEEMFGESTESLRGALASIKVGKDWGKKVENFATTLDDFSKDLDDIAMTDLIKGIFGGADGTGLTRDDIAKYQNPDLKAEAQLEAFFNKLPQDLQDQFGGLDKFKEYYQQQIIDAEEIFANATKKMDAYGIKANSIPGDLSAGGLKGLSDHLAEIVNITSVDNANSIAKTLGDITKEMSKAEMESFYSQLNALDWSSIQSLDGLKHTLRELGIYVPEDKLNNLTNQIKDFGKASNAVDLGQLTEQLVSIQNLVDDISSRERGEYTFSEEDKNKLVDTGFIDSNMFVGYGDSWRYVGDNLDVLIDALHQNTMAILKDTKGELEDQIKTAQIANKAVAEGEVDYSNAATLTTEEKQRLLLDTLNYINTHNTEAINEDDKITSIDGYSLEALANIANAKNLEVSQVDFLDTILQSLADKSTIEALERLESQYASANREVGILNYLNQPTSTIATAATATVDPNATNAAEQQTEVDNATNALLYKARAYAELDDEIRAYNEALATNNKEIINEAKKTLAAQLAIEEKAEALDNLDDKVEDHLEALKEINKDTGAYDEQLADLAEDLSDAFDIDLDSTFLSDNSYENLTLLEQAIKGSQSAWDQLLINMQKAQLESQNFRNDFGLTGDQVQNIAAALDGVIFHSEGRADMTQVVNALYSAGKSAEDVAEILNLLGYTDIKFSTDTETLTLPDGSSVEVPKRVTATNVNVPAARRSSSFGGGGRNSGSKGGGGSSKDKWENPYDSFYNINSDINDVLEKRNLLEKEYDLLLQNENASIDDYIKSYEQRIGSYKEEIALAKEALRMREQERANLLSKNSDLSKYAWIDENDEVKINYELISKVTNEEEGERIEEYIDRLETNAEETDKLNETIADNTLAIENLIDEWRQTTADFEKEIFDALVWEREQQIEQFESVADSIETANSDLVSAIQNTIDERRQKRDNEETEQELSDKERRLAYLQQDTSGANEQEILQLQKEIKEGKQDYTDTLIDQKISELEKQNEEAAKQREKQIQLMQYQLENDKNTGVIANQVHQLLKNATSNEGWNNVWELLAKSAGFKGLTQTEQQVWIEETQKDFKNAMAYLGSGGLVEDLSNISVQNINNYNYSGNDTIETGTGNGSGGSSGSGGSGGSSKGGSSNDEKYYKYTDVVEDYKKQKYYKINNLWYKDDQISNIRTNSKEASLVDKAVSSKYFMAKAQVGGTNPEDIILNQAANKSSAIQESKNTLYHKYGSIDTGKYIYYKYSDGYYYHENDIQAKKIRGESGYFGAIKRGAYRYKRYKTGGLADFTGPAWLDGTKSKPELVLNQKDTQNFLQLKDILGSFMKHSNTNNYDNRSGDTTYDISITVEKMNSDYDVEQVASKIKQMITSDALYRNSNLISRLR